MGQFLPVYLYLSQNIFYDATSGGGPVHARVPIHAHAQFS